MSMLIVVLAVFLTVSTAYVLPAEKSRGQSTRLYYNYDKKLPEGQKKEVIDDGVVVVMFAYVSL